MTTATTVYTLLNGEDRNAEYPDTFGIPPRSERISRLPGDTVKLGFELRDPQPGDFGGERMWVCITEVSPDGRYTGTLDNEPFVLPLSHGDIVTFGPEHIIDIFDERS